VCAELINGVWGGGAKWLIEYWGPKKEKLQKDVINVMKSFMVFSLHLLSYDNRIKEDEMGDISSGNVEVRIILFWNPSKISPGEVPDWERRRKMPAVELETGLASSVNMSRTLQYYVALKLPVIGSSTVQCYVF
jgi:hypothetical protein